MNSVELSYIIGSIDDDLLHEAENSSGVKIEKKPILIKWREIAALAACFLVLISVFVAVPKMTDKMNIFIKYQGRTYSSLSEIPIKKMGMNYLLGGNMGGPVELFVLDGIMYFSKVTRWIGNDITHETVLYYTLFRYNTSDNSCTAISDEVGYIHLSNDRFIYDRSDIYLTGPNRWSVDYYTNNAKWDDETMVSGEEAKLLIASQIPTIIPYGKSDTYTISNDYSSILVNFNESHRMYEIRPDFSSLIQSDKGVTINNVIGIANEKVYFSANFNLAGKYCWELFCINLDGTGLKLITSDKSTHVIGTGAFIGKDGFIYYHYRGDKSYILKVDPQNDEPQLVAEVDAYIWEWVTDGKYILCQIDGGGPDKPANLKLLKIKEEPETSQVEVSDNAKTITITINVETVDELFDAIAPNRIIKLTGKTYKLDELADKDKTSQYAFFRPNGEELVIHDVRNLTIIGANDIKTKIFTKFVDADVLSFENVRNVSISNIRMGHWPEKGGCSGGVIFFKDSNDIDIERCDFFGCGINGLELRTVKNFRFINSVIENCSFHIMSVANSENIYFKDSGFINNIGGELINISGSTNVIFEKCDISDNEGSTDIGVLFAVDLGYSAYVSPFENNGMVSQILVRDSFIKRNHSTSPSIIRTINKNTYNVRFENVEFEGNNFDLP